MIPSILRALLRCERFWGRSMKINVVFRKNSLAAHFHSAAAQNYHLKGGCAG